MRKIAILSVLVFILILAAACGTTTHEVKIQESGALLLSQSDLETFFSKELNIRWVTNKYNGTTIYRPDGTASVAGRGFSDTGTYWIEDGQYCSKWNNIRTNVKCNKWYKLSEKEYHQIDSSGQLVAKVYID